MTKSELKNHVKNQNLISLIDDGAEITYDMNGGSIGAIIINDEFEYSKSWGNLFITSIINNDYLIPVQQVVDDKEQLNKFREITSNIINSIVANNTEEVEMDLAQLICSKTLDVRIFEVRKIVDLNKELAKKVIEQNRIIDELRLKLALNS